MYGTDWADVENRRRVIDRLSDDVGPFFESLLLDKPGAGTLYGLRGLQSFGEAVEEDFVGLEYWPARYERVAPSRIVVSGEVRARTRMSGQRLHGDFAHVWTILNGRVARVEAYADRAAAMEAVGAKLV